VIRRGICSVTLRHLSVEDVVAVAAGAGLAAVEWGADVHVPAGDDAAADAARSACERLGLAVASYGSYFRAGHDAPEAFAAVLATARRLGAGRIRIWAGTIPSRDAGPQQRTAVAAAARRAAEEAGEAGIQVALEYHGGTLTDDPASTLALLEAVDSLWTYWQPPEGMPDDAALAGLQHLLSHVVALHVFSWWPGRERRPLEARAGLWRRAFALAGSRADDLDALLEFVPDDDAAVVTREARTMDVLLTAGARA
jgi:xylose isomerase-like TIM barrel protein